MNNPERATATRDLLLDSAESAFARHGYDATGVAEICTAARVSKGAFYHHFPTKQALFLALLERRLAALDASFQTIRANAGNPVEAIERMAELLRPLFKDSPGQTQNVMVFEFWSQARREPAVWQVIIDPYRRYRTFMADMIRNGIASGAFKPVDPNLAAHMLISQMAGLLLQSMLDPEATDWGALLRDSVRQFVTNLAPLIEKPALTIGAPSTLPLIEFKKKKKKSKHKH